MVKRTVSGRLNVFQACGCDCDSLKKEQCIPCQIETGSV